AEQVDGGLHGADLVRLSELALALAPLAVEGVALHQEDGRGWSRGAEPISLNRCHDTPESLGTAIAQLELFAEREGNALSLPLAVAVIHRVGRIPEARFEALHGGPLPFAHRQTRAIRYSENVVAEAQDRALFLGTASVDRTGRELLLDGL